MNRRTTLKALMAGAAAGLALVAYRKGFTGAGKLAVRMGKPLQPEAKTNMYGYKEIKLS
ncbi:MAG TPA: hypothetical protein VD902_01370 [Symbiobacteriaceae bacterium]|nr:hypothetical protein [Symbiobacteriaceae bacterium]